MTTDTILVERLRRGDAASLLTIQKRYGAKLLYKARSYMRSAEAAEDALQEVWMKLYLSRESLRGDGLAGWLYRTLHNCCVDALRAAGRTPQSEALSDVVVTIDVDSPRLADVIEAIRSLGRDDAELMALRLLTPLTIDEIGILLIRPGVPHETVRSRLFRAKARLSERLQTAHA